VTALAGSPRTDQFCGTRCGRFRTGPVCCFLTGRALQVRSQGRLPRRDIIGAWELADWSPSMIDRPWHKRSPRRHRGRSAIPPVVPYVDASATLEHVRLDLSLLPCVAARCRASSCRGWRCGGVLAGQSSRARTSGGWRHAVARLCVFRSAFASVGGPPPARTRARSG
jgi:hypothetical protein